MDLYNWEAPISEQSCMKLTSEKQKSEFRVSKSISLTDLIEKLHEAFETNDVNIDYVQDLMSAYRSNPHEWKKFAKFDRHR